MNAKDLQRFLRFVDIPDDNSCWTWQGHTARGYGQFWCGDRNLRAHRASYEHFVGPIPSGMEIDHLCRTRGCVNPAHLEPVTTAENLRRATQQISTVNAAKTHCVNGHPFSSENTYSARGKRECRICRTEASRRCVERRLNKEALL